MPQNNPFPPAVTPAGKGSPLHLDSTGAERTNSTPASRKLNITAATVVKAGPGRVGNVQVVVGGSAAGAIYDCLATADIAAANQLCTVPVLTTAQISSMTINSSMITGLVVVPGTGQTLAVSYE